MIDWNKIRADHEARVRWEQEQGITPAPPPKVKKKRAPSNGGAGGRPPKYDRERIVELYLDGRHVPEVAAEIGCDKQTVYRALAAANVDLRDDRLTLPGPAPRTHCIRQHPFDEKNTRVDKRGNRHCRTCERARWARYNAKKSSI